MNDLSTRKAINAITGLISEKSLASAEVAAGIAKEVGRTAAQVALAWTLVNPAVTSPVMGVRTLEQLKDNLGALEVELGPEHLARLNAVSSILPIFPTSVLKSPAEGMMFGNVRVRMRG
jgi:aryl-alcohol dehydrogenase-like predicted oxidoreductase